MRYFISELLVILYRNPIRYFLIFLFLISLLLRFWLATHHIGFAQDHGRDLLIMREFADNGKVIVEYGPKASVGDFFLPPFFYQIHYFVDLASGSSPLAMKWVVALIESFTPILLFLILRIFVRNQYAAIGSLLYAFSPTVISYGVSMWSPAVVPFFSTLALLSWMGYILKEKPWLIITGSVATSLALHLHYQAIIIFPVACIIFLFSLYKNLRDWKYWVMGVLISMIFFVPYLIGEINSGFQNTNSIMNFLSGEHRYYFDRVSKPSFIIEFLPAFFERLLIGENVYGYLIGRITLILGFISLVTLSIRSHKYRWLFAVLLTMLFMLRVYKGDKLDYYMSVLFIWPFILSSLSLEYFGRKALVIPVVIAVFAGITFSQVPSDDSLSVLKQTIEWIQDESESRDMQVIFHDPEKENVFIYGFEVFSTMEPSKHGTTLIDVCKRRSDCAGFDRLVCVNSELYTQTSWYKYNSNYQLKNQKTFPGHHIVIGTAGK